MEIFIICIQKATVPFHVDAATVSKSVEAVEDPVTGHLDTPHWEDKGMLKAKILADFLSEHQQQTVRELTAHTHREMVSLGSC